MSGFRAAALAALACLHPVVNASASVGGHSILFVDDSAPPGGTGSGWATALGNLQVALTIARASGGAITEIRVGQGVYRPAPPKGDRTIAFALVDGLALRGGYAGFGADDPHARDSASYPSILSGDLNENDGGDFSGYEENSYHVVTADGTNSSAVLEGFVVEHGNADDASIPHDAGGGMRVDRGSPSVIACDFIENTAVFGGGLENFDGSNPQIIRCNFVGNRATFRGGGMHNNGSSPLVDGCVFDSNSAINSGGGMRNWQGSNPAVCDSEFIANHAGFGGGMVNDESAPRVERCTFLDNTSDGTSAGMHNWRSNPTIHGCRFDTNRAVDVGGGMFNTDQSSPTIHYSTFQGNQAAAGGGMFAHAETSAEVEASTFFNNAALLGNGGAIKSIAGATLWLSRCSFIDNNAFHAGGALHTVGAVHLDRCNFRRNSAQAGGGAVAHSEGGLAADSCLFHDNAAAAVGGIALSGTGNSFVNCTIFGNRSEVVGGGVLLGSFGALAVTQSVLWGNRIGEDGSEFAQIGWEEGAALDLFYSAVEGLSGSLGGVGNIAADPMFVDPLGPDGLPGTGDENLRLSAGSPCINAGDPGFTPDLNATDLDGHARALCGRVDMGAYEFGIGDVDCDQSVGLADYAQFPRCITGPPGNRSEAFGCEALDFNADNFIDLSDYAGFQNVMTHEP